MFSAKPHAFCRSSNARMVFAVQCQCALAEASHLLFAEWLTLVRSVTSVKVYFTFPIFLLQWMFVSGRGCCLEPLPLCPNGGRASMRCYRGAECPPGYGCTPLGTCAYANSLCSSCHLDSTKQNNGKYLLIFFLQAVAAFFQWNQCAQPDPTQFANARLTMFVHLVPAAQWARAARAVSVRWFRSAFLDWAARARISVMDSKTAAPSVSKGFAHVWTEQHPTEQLVNKWLQQF